MLYINYLSITMSHLECFIFILITSILRKKLRMAIIQNLTNQLKVDMENIYTVSRPLLTFSKYLGVFPMSFHGHTRKGILKVEWSDVIISCFSLITLFCVVALNLALKGTLMDDTLILARAWKILLNLEFLSYTFLFAYQLQKRRNVLKFLKCIEVIDEEVRRILENSIKKYFLTRLFFSRLKAYTF